MSEALGMLGAGPGTAFEPAKLSMCRVSVAPVTRSPPRRSRKGVAKRSVTASGGGGQTRVRGASGAPSRGSIPARRKGTRWPVTPRAAASTSAWVT